MKPNKKNTIRVFSVIVLVVFAVSIYNASLIQLYYRAVTSKTEKEENTTRYHYLAMEEIKLSGDSKVPIREERRKLYYWFHARGWSIDEDEESQSRPWHDLRIYWKNQSREQSSAGQSTARSESKL